MKEIERTSKTLTKKLMNCKGKQPKYWPMSIKMIDEYLIISNNYSFSFKYRYCFC